MIKTVQLLYLALYVSATLIQYAHLPAVRQLPYAYVWAFAALSYPLCLALMRKGTGFWKALSTIVLFAVLAQALEAVIYLVRAGGHPHGVFYLFLILGLYFIATLVYTAIWFPIGYFVAWFVLRRGARTRTADTPEV